MKEKIMQPPPSPVAGEEFPILDANMVAIMITQV